MQGDPKNLLIAIVLCTAILFGWEFFFRAPQGTQPPAQQTADGRQTQQGTTQQGATQQGATQEGATGDLLPLGEQTLPTPDQQTSQTKGTTGETGNDLLGDASSLPAPDGSTEEQGGEVNNALSRGAMVAIETPALKGSIALKGAKVERIILRDFRETLADDAPPITLLQTEPSPYFVQFAWRVSEGVEAPDHNTLWQSEQTRLTPSSPLLLHWTNEADVRFELRFSIDDHYMITLEQRVVNGSERVITVQPYGVIQRQGKPPTLDFFILHEGLIGYLDSSLEEITYKKALKKQRFAYKSKGGWLGITDKYWMTVLVPDAGKSVNALFRTATRQRPSDGLSIDVFQADILYPTSNLAPQEKVEQVSRLFVGAKSVPLLDRYAQQHDIAGFDLAVDFGWFYFITKPIYHAITFFSQLLGNFGLAILALTVVIKILFLPLSYKSYVSISKMKTLQPEMTTLRERHKGDKKALQQDMLALYKKHGVNPVAGCLPILLQIPVFFALYKVLFVSIEMRHAPFFGWIHDLSAPDPLGMLTLFGLVTWQVPQLLQPLNLGLWPIVMGLSMWLQQKMNPAPVDPIQKKIFAFLPILFTFLLGRFPAGLVIYWTWNNVLTIAQQWVITRHVNRNMTKTKPPDAQRTQRRTQRRTPRRTNPQ